MKSKEIHIFGATHIGLRLARKLASEFTVIVFDQYKTSPETPDGWTYTNINFSVLPNLHKSEIAYVATDEDKINIRISLAINSAHPSLKVITTLTQSKLGKKLATHIPNFSFINPAELAAIAFIETLVAPIPNNANQLPNVSITEEISTLKCSRVDPLVFRALLFFSFLAVSTTIYFHFAENLSWVDSWYFVVTLMTTVGFGDISLKNSSAISKLVGTFLMIASVTNTAVIFALITDSLLKQRLTIAFNRKKQKQSDHIIIIGIGSVGIKVATKLFELGEKVTIIESNINARFMPEILSLNCPIIIGDGKLEHTLRDANLKEAKALFCVTSNDLSNLEIGLSAKAINPNARVILRIYDQILSQSLNKQLDIHFALSTSSIAADELVKHLPKTE